jgi:hypothetical protein
LPSLGPSDLKLGLTFLINIPEELLISSTSLTFTSDLISSEISRISFFSQSKSPG